MVGIETSDDAGVYRLNSTQAIVQTVDFFTPIVDDPFSFGQIAAANALSDIYAMGAKPLTAMNLVSFPINKLDKGILLEILQGGMDKIRESGTTLIGGHSIDDPEPKYGLSVTGIVHPGKVLTNSGAKPGDSLVLTKPLGLGIITTGIKNAVVSKEDESEALRVMTGLNEKASEIAVQVGVHACTDITGFGLLGHLQEMLKASGCSAEIYPSYVPVLDSVWDCLTKGMVPGGTRANLNYLRSSLESHCSSEWELILADAQTSGGLLLALPDEKLEELNQLFGVENLKTHVIGKVTAGRPSRIIIKSEK